MMSREAVGRAMSGRRKGEVTLHPDGWPLPMPDPDPTALARGMPMHRAAHAG